MTRWKSSVLLLATTLAGPAELLAEKQDSDQPVARREGKDDHSPPTKALAIGATLVSFALLAGAFVLAKNRKR